LQNLGVKEQLGMVNRRLNSLLVGLALNAATAADPALGEHASAGFDDYEHISADSEAKNEPQTIETQLISALDRSDFVEKDPLKQQLQQGIQSLDAEGLTLLQNFLQTPSGAALDPSGSLKQSIVKARLSAVADTSYSNSDPNLPPRREEATGSVPKPLAPEFPQLNTEAEMRLNDWKGTMKMTEMEDRKTAGILSRSANTNFTLPELNIPALEKTPDEPALSSPLVAAEPKSPEAYAPPTDIFSTGLVSGSESLLPSGATLPDELPATSKRRSSSDLYRMMEVSSYDEPDKKKGQLPFGN
jgi:hypothetical protein